MNFSWRAAAAGVPLSVVYLLLFWITATFVLLVRPGWTFRLSTGWPFAAVAVVIVVNAVVEELIVTRLVVQSLTARGAAVAIIASALARSVWHLPLGPLAAISVIPPGLFLAALYWQRRTLWPLIVAQAIAHLVIFALAP